MTQTRLVFRTDMNPRMYIEIDYSALPPTPLPPANAERDAGLDWGVALLRRLPEIERPELRTWWEGPEGRRHRAVLKEQSPGALLQLVEHVKERLEALPKEEPK